MSPVAQTNHHAARAALVALVGIVVLFGALGLVTLALRDRNSPDLRLGDQTFQGGRTTRIANDIAKRGPILYSDVSGRKDRDMILQHIGSDPAKGWHAFLAAPLSKPRDCTWRWAPKDNHFVASCDEKLTAPADGAGLPKFKVTVTGGHIAVDLNADARATTTTTAPR